MSSDSWHILGAGAIGCVWAAELHAAGREPVLILKDAGRLQQYSRAGGITIERDGVHHPHNVAATCPARLETPIRRLLVTTKAHQTHDALRSLGPSLTDDTAIVLMHNGLGVVEEIRTLHPTLMICQASTTEGAYRRALFEVVHAGRGNTVIGSTSPDVTPTRLGRIAEALATDTLPVRPTDDIERILWRKLAINCAINPLTVIYRCLNGELLENAEARAAIHRIAEEIIAVSRELARGTWVADLEVSILEVARATARNRSSMLQDVEAGRRTEIDYINGYLCSVAASSGIDVPANREMVERVHRLNG